MIQKLIELIQEQSKAFDKELFENKIIVFFAHIVGFIGFVLFMLSVLLMMFCEKPRQNTTHMATQSANRAQEICVICTEPINTEKNSVITPCKHQFCMTCFLKHMFTANTCPLCRREIYKKARRTTRIPTN